MTALRNSPSPRRLAELIVIAGVTCLALVVVSASPREKLRLAIQEQTQFMDLQARLQTQLAALEAADVSNGVPVGFGWPGTDRSTVEASLQQSLVEASERNGLTLTSFGPVDAPPMEVSPTIGFSVEGSVTWPRLLGFLSDLNGAIPPLAISDLTLRPASYAENADGASSVWVRLVAWGFAPGLAGAP